MMRIILGGLIATLGWVLFLLLQFPIISKFFPLIFLISIIFIITGVLVALGIF